MESKIDRYEVITVETVNKNQYGDLIVNGNIKIGVKRNHLFGVFQSGAEVKLGYASYMNKEYVSTAEQTGVHKPQKDISPIAETKSEISPQEKGMWWKELGECLRDGTINKDDSESGTYLWKCYINQMVTSLGLSRSKLIDEIKAAGGKEINDKM
jgi:hypothetical protein